MAICSRTGKRKFDTELDAQISISTVQSSNAHHRHRSHRDEPSRAYECEFCHSWHTTSQAKRKLAGKN